MNSSRRPILALTGLVLLLAACTPAANSPSSSPLPTDSPQPSAAASEAPDASPEPVGTLTVTDGAVPGGPGISLSEAMAGDLSQPVLVRGTLFMDTEGAIYFAESTVDASEPAFGDLRVSVDNYPTEGPTWDIGDADITGLQEANGILFFEDTTLYGTISQ